MNLSSVQRKEGEAEGAEWLYCYHEDYHLYKGRKVRLKVLICDTVAVNTVIYTKEDET